MRLSIVAMIAFVSVAGALAQDVELTLDEALELAIAGNADLMAQYAATEGALRDLQSAWNTFMPGLSAGLALSWDGPSLLGTEGPGYSSDSPLGTKLSLGVQLSLGTASAFELSERRLAAESATLTRREAGARLVRDVEKAYFQLVVYKQDIANKARVIKLAEERLALARTRYQNGLVPELEILRAELSVWNSRPAYQKAETDYRKRLASFKRLVGYEGEGDFSLTSPLIVAASTGTISVPGDRLADRFDVERLTLAKASNDLAARKALATVKLPVVSLGASWNASSSDFADPIDSLTVSAGIAFSVDSWIPGSKKDLSVQLFADSARRLEIQYTDVLRAARDEISGLVLDLESAGTNIELAGRQATLAERIYEKTREAYRLGSATFLELEDAQQDVSTAEQALLGYRYQYLSVLIDLGYALNTDWRLLLQ
ncbi:MAG: TolC family protein [Spirochaetales bacterium]|nr:MAG: TolC family protein [Spirochaetales bacterium]